MARASTPTLLSLDRYAQVIGLNPAHFNTAAGETVMPYVDCCTDIWFQYDWQYHGRTSREALAQAIADAETDIAEVIGYFPAPKWFSEEIIQYPKHHRAELARFSMRDARLHNIGVRARWGYIIGPGQRAVTLVGTPAIVYSDEDGDGFDETATVSIATSETDERLVKVYTTGMTGNQEWEIRPARTKAISAGTFTATFWSWQMIDPDLWEALATSTDPTPIDWTDNTNLVATVDVYIEYNDTTETSCQLIWDSSLPHTWICPECNGSGCTACTLTVQDGCVQVRNPKEGLITPQAASYNASEDIWEPNYLSEARDPDMVKVWYYAGFLDNRYLASNTTDPLSQWWAQTIAWLATARLERPFCSCDNVVDLVKDLRTDLSQVGGPFSYNVTLEDLSNPFGSRKGAVLAWRRISKLARKRAKVAVI